MTGKQVFSLIQTQTENLSVQVIILIPQLVVLLREQMQKESSESRFGMCGVANKESAVQYQKVLNKIVSFESMKICERNIITLTKSKFVLYKMSPSQIT